MNTSQESVDVLLCSYNSQETIEKCLTSILNQTHRNIRLLVFDDASTDNTVSIIRSFKDYRLHLFKSEKNVGTYAGKNYLLKNISSSKYIALHDSDDVSERTRIEKQINFFSSKKDAAVVGTSVFEVGRKDLMHTKSKESLIQDKRLNTYPSVIGSKILEDIVSFLNEDYKKYLKLKICMNGTVCFKRSDLINVGGWDGNTRIAGDTDIFCRLLMLEGKKIYNLNEPLYTRYFNKNSLTASKELGINSEKRKSYNMLLKDKIEQREFKSNLYFPSLKVEKVKCAE